jgi:hypothetical protein
MESVASGFASDLDKMCNGFDAGTEVRSNPNGNAIAKAATEQICPASRSDDNKKATGWGEESGRAFSAPNEQKTLVGTPVRTMHPFQIEIWGHRASGKLSKRLWARARPWRRRLCELVFILG